MDANAKRLSQQSRNSGTARKLHPPARGSSGGLDAQRLAKELGGELSDSDGEDDAEDRFQMALLRSQSMTPEQVAMARKSRPSRVGAMSVTGGNREGKSDWVSSPGAQPMTGGLRQSKSFDGDSAEEEDDAVQEYIAQLPRRSGNEQNIAATASTGVRYSGSGREDNTLDWNQAQDEEDMAKRRYESTSTPYEGEDLMAEAQVGLPAVQPVMQPGAFAVEGMDATNNDDDEFYDVDDDDMVDVGQMERGTSTGSSGLAHRPGGGDNPMDVISAFYDGEDEEVLEFYDDQGGLQAELHQEPLFVDAQVFDDSALSPKAQKRLRWMQGSVFCMAMAAIVGVIGLAITRPEPIDPWKIVIPTITGWSQVGQNLTGPLLDDKSLFGYTVAMAGNALRIAVGMPGHDLGATELMVGEVQIYDWNGTQWSPTFGADQLPLLGPGPEAQAGTALAISKNGNRVAVGSPYYQTGGGHVIVYEANEEEEQWKHVGQMLLHDKQDEDARFGGSLALSDDGKVLAVGASMAGENNQGYVKVFRLQDGKREWVPVGGKLMGNHPEEFFGWSVALARNGTRVSVGAVGSVGNSTGEFAGIVHVFDYVESTDSWVEPSAPIPGESAFDSFGSSVSMNEQGDVLAVGAIGHSTEEGGVDIGHVRVFRYNEEHPDGPKWIQQGQTLLGQSGFDSFGYSVSLSEDGTVVAAGGPQNNEFAESSGQIQVYKWDPATAFWQRVGGNIGGSYVGNELFGW